MYDRKIVTVWFKKIPILPPLLTGASNFLSPKLCNFFLYDPPSLYSFSEVSFFLHSWVVKLGLSQILKWESPITSNKLVILVFFFSKSFKSSISTKLLSQSHKIYIYIYIKLGKQNFKESLKIQNVIIIVIFILFFSSTQSELVSLPANGNE